MDKLINKPVTNARVLRNEVTKLSVPEAAPLVECTPQHLYRIENLETGPGTVIIDKLLELFGCDYRELFDPISPERIKQLRSAYLRREADQIDADAAGAEQTKPIEEDPSNANDH